MKTRFVPSMSAAPADGLRRGCRASVTMTSSCCPSLAMRRVSPSLKAARILRMSWARSAGISRRPLFDRSPQGVEPTLYGRALRKLAITVFDDVRQGIQEIEFLADPTAGELRIGCTESMAGGLVSAAIGRLSRQYPQLIFHMELANSDVLQLQTLRERKCELD
jgi:hypothetical protein